MERTWLFLAALLVCAQEPLPVAPLQFEASSVKAAQPESGVFPRITSDPGRLKPQSVSIDALIAYAYGVQPAQIINMKSGLGIYDVEAKAEGAHSQAEFRVMLQGLLAERFRMKFHREMREMMVDRLVIGKNLKLHQSALAEEDPHGFTLHASDRSTDFLQAKATAMSLDWLANNLSGSMAKLVVDDTGLKGVYEFEIEFEFDSAEVRDKSVPVRAAGNHIREGMLSAMGLKLQGGKKEPVEVLVIDHVERPEAN